MKQVQLLINDDERDAQLSLIHDQNHSLSSQSGLAETRLQLTPCLILKCVYTRNLIYHTGRNHCNVLFSVSEEYKSISCKTEHCLFMCLYTVFNGLRVSFGAETQNCAPAFMLPTEASAVLINPTTQTLQPRVQNPGNPQQGPSPGTIKRMLNTSQHLSYSNMPMSRQSDWLDGPAGMGKQADSVPNNVFLICIHSKWGFLLRSSWEKNNNRKEEKGTEAGSEHRRGAALPAVCIYLHVLVKLIQ